MHMATVPSYGNKHGCRYSVFNRPGAVTLKRAMLFPPHFHLRADSQGYIFNILFKI